MNKIKILLVCVLVGLCVAAAFVFLKMKDKDNYRQKTLLAQQIHKVLEHLMFDLYDVGESTIQQVPADGQWHTRIVFAHAGRDVRVEYQLRAGHLWRLNNGNALLIADHIGAWRIRRQKATPDILEVQIEARDNVSLLSNLKIKVRH